MRLRVQIMIEPDDSAPPVVEEVACIERTTLSPATLGLTLAEAKAVLGQIQETMTAQQVSACIAQYEYCPHCQRPLAKKGQHEFVMRTLFGTLMLESPRFYTCPCQSHSQRSWSPVAALFPERTTPEFLAFQVKWASLLSYGITANLLSDLLPLEHPISTATLSRHVQQMAERLEGELGEEQYSFIEGCPQEWHRLPEPEAPLTVSVDGGYVHARSEGRRQDGSFEVLVGKSVTGDGQAKRLGSVYGYDQKPRRRVCEVLRAQGMQMNQAVTFLTDGGDTVRDLIDGLNPLAEHVLDWFHVTMRLTILKQFAKGAPEESKSEQFDEELDRVKWYLWHGNIFKATRLTEDLRLEIDEESGDAARKLARALDEFHGYILSNRTSIPNYGDRYRNGEPISSSLAESTVNQVISKRFVKKQQMRWTRRGAHLLLQVRTQVLNEELRTTFARWYPGMQEQPRAA